MFPLLSADRSTHRAHVLSLHFVVTLLTQTTRLKMCTPIKILVLLSLVSYSVCSVKIVKDIVQFNVAGHPVLHKETEWDFDPDVAIRRSRQYQELNGRYGAKAIERLGLGIDGYDRERLAQQRLRDEGHLNGLTE
ncbi:uncharacterized protein LOC659330 [Tribolium castaneum]|nr:PREDICTED: uncharacterized protein LOC659330 [Tribolium castaneum]|eukprot:XP_970740.2 PREDICTED: uncharacterized protein LOC659330 [Tribolium castaneum]